MRKLLIILLFTSLSLWGYSSDEVTVAKEQLQRAKSLINSILPATDRIETSRLTFLKKNIIATETAVEQNGLAHAATMRSYQHLIVAFRYSSSFFKQIETGYSVNALKELVDIYELIVKARGFDDTPYTQITANVFTEMHQLVLQLKSLSTLPDSLKPKLDALIPKLGNVIAVAKEGDRPKTFSASIPVSKEITALYADFGTIQHANSAFDIVLDIQGLNEFYSEFAQIEGDR